jgi:hypothetical protein
MAPDLELSDEQRRKAADDAGESLAREGLKPGVVEEWEDGYRTAEEPDGFEWWYFDSQFEEGWTAVVVFSTKPMTTPHKGLRPSVAIIVHTPEGKRLRVSPTFEAGDLEASTSTCDVKIGPNTIKGDLDTYEMHAEGEGVSVDLVFKRGAPSWRPGAGISYLNRKKDKYFAWVAAIPYGTVEGTITVDGKPNAVKGTGYHDHNWGNISPGLGIDHWYWGRAHVGEYSMIFVQIVTAKIIGIGSLKLPVFYLAKGDEIITDEGLPLSLVTGDYVQGPGGKSYPRKLDFHWNTEDGDILLAIRNPELIERIDVIEDLPRWQQAVIHLFANPTYFDFNAELELTIDYKGIKESEKGKALYEIMMFK